MCVVYPSSSKQTSRIRWTDNDNEILYWGIFMKKFPVASVLVKIRWIWRSLYMKIFVHVCVHFRRTEATWHCPTPGTSDTSWLCLDCTESHVFLFSSCRPALEYCRWLLYPRLLHKLCLTVSLNSCQSFGSCGENILVIACCVREVERHTWNIPVPQFFVCNFQP